MILLEAISLLGYWRNHNDYQKWLKLKLVSLMPEHEAQIRFYAPLVEKVYILNFDPVKEIIASLYSPVGRPAKNQPELLRALIVMIHLISGLGPILTAGIIAEIGKIKRFDNHNALAKYAGLAWNKYQSGEFEAEDTKRMRTGNKYLRYYLIQATDSVRKSNPEYRKFYQKKYAEVPKHQQ